MTSKNVDIYLVRIHSHTHIYERIEKKRTHFQETTKKIGNENSVLYERIQYCTHSVCGMKEHSKVIVRVLEMEEAHLNIKFDLN